MSLHKKIMNSNFEELTEEDFKHLADHIEHYSEDLKDLEAKSKHFASLATSLELQGQLQQAKYMFRKHAITLSRAAKLREMLSKLKHYEH